MEKFIITGVGRSGTGYIATLLTALAAPFISQLTNQAHVFHQVRSADLAYQRYRLEDVTPEMIQRVILLPLGLQYDESIILKAQEKIGTKTNRRTRNLTISNQTLKQYSMYAHFESLANEYGYDLDKLS